MPPYVVQRGYVTAETKVGRGRAAVDFGAGSVLPEDVPAEELAALKRSGAVVWVDDEQPEEAADPSKRPVKSAPKAPWVAWAVHVHGYPVEEAELMTLADLKALPDDPVTPKGSGSQADDDPEGEQPEGDDGESEDDEDGGE